MAQWLLIGGGVILVAALVVMRRRLLDRSGPGRITEHDPVPWNGVDRRRGDDDDGAA